VSASNVRCDNTLDAAGGPIVEEGLNNPGYRKAVKENLPKAAIVFDHFHISKLFNEKLTELRRELHREATDALRKRVLKGARWLILKDPANLDQERDEKRRLKEALRLNEPLAAAYYMKEELRWFWRQPGKTFATHFLDGWLKRAQASGIKVLHQMAKTLALYRSGLLAYYDAMITSGPLEGTNNKIKTLKRTPYGFRDHEFFKLKILALHETRYELVG
jgi:transposase